MFVFVLIDLTYAYLLRNTENTLLQSCLLPKTTIMKNAGRLPAYEIKYNTQHQDVNED